MLFAAKQRNVGAEGLSINFFKSREEYWAFRSLLTPSIPESDCGDLHLCVWMGIFGSGICVDI
jgi:hypothetical protein